MSVEVTFFLVFPAISITPLFLPKPAAESPRQCIPELANLLCMAEMVDCCPLQTRDASRIDVVGHVASSCESLLDPPRLTADSFAIAARCFEDPLPADEIATYFRPDGMRQMDDRTEHLGGDTFRSGKCASR